MPEAYQTRDVQLASQPRSVEEGGLGRGPPLDAVAGIEDGADRLGQLLLRNQEVARIEGRQQ
jgi:hypothetical protein